jgi:hypothetical protein
VATNATPLERPSPSDFVPYFRQYIDKVPAGDVLAILESQIEETVAALGALSEEKALHRYAPGKWSVKEIVGHLADSERIFAYRALRFARGDATALPGFEQDDYVAPSGADQRSLADLLGEFAAVRRASLCLFRGFDGAAWARRGVASGNEFAVRAFPFIVAGHERHHLAVIRQRYL